MPFQPPPPLQKKKKLKKSRSISSRLTLLPTILDNQCLCSPSQKSWTMSACLALLSTILDNQFPSSLQQRVCWSPHRLDLNISLQYMLESAFSSQGLFCRVIYQYPHFLIRYQKSQRVKLMASTLCQMSRRFNLLGAIGSFKGHILAYTKAQNYQVPVNQLVVTNKGQVSGKKDGQLF